MARTIEVTKGNGKKIVMEIKPCPICGDEDVLISKHKGRETAHKWPMYEIYCPHCEMVFMMSDWAAGLRTLLMTWNRRKER